jgi:hypothetical protein
MLPADVSVQIKVIACNTSSAGRAAEADPKAEDSAFGTLPL